MFFNKYYIYFIILLLLFGLQKSSVAENWQDISTKKKEAYIDTDSIKLSKGRPYYKVKYYSKKNNQDVVAFIMTNKEYFSVIQTCSYINRNDTNICKSIDYDNYIGMISKVKNNSIIANANAVVWEKLPISNTITSKAGKKYIKEVQKQIKKLWHPKDYKKSLHAKVLFNVDKTGNVHNIKIIKSSRDTGFDKYAIDTVKKAAPYPVPPSDFTEIHFDFQYNIYFEKEKDSL